MGVKSLRMHGKRTDLCLTPRILPQAVDLPPGAGVTEWFCAGGLQQDAEKQSAFQFQSAPLPGTGSYTRRPNMLPTARGLFNGTLVGSLAQCEAACDKQPGCQGFTRGTHEDCYFYYHVKSLLAAPGVEWFQKPSVARPPDQTASRSVQRALLTPQANPGSLYRCRRST